MKTEHRILEVLASSDRELYGLDLVAKGAVKRSWLFVTLGRMEEQGLIEGREEAAAAPLLPRRLYRITDKGRALLLPVAKVRQ